MRPTSSQQNPPQWRLGTAIIISLLLVLFMIMFMQYSAIFAAPDTVEVNVIQAISSSPTDVKGSTILVGLSTTAENMVNGVFLYQDELTTLDSQIASTESLLSFEESVYPKTANALSQVNQIYKVHLEPGADAAVAIRRLEANPNVLFAEPDYLAHLITTPNDPLYNGQWGLTKINAPAAWDVTTGSNSVVIAVIDSGLDIDHPDLAGQLWTNPGEIAGNGIDDDNNGHIDDIHGWNMIDDNADLSDNTGHGTEVAGVLGAVSNNGQGVAGVCWDCRLMVLKVTQSGGVANYSDIIEAVHYAALKGADVINLSLGGSSDSVSLRLAVDEAAETAVVVGGAGNDNNDTLFYPAAYESVLAVAGTGVSDAKVSSSNYGSWVNVTAPGETITTTFDGGSYGMTSGTSMAAPYVSGLAGLLRSANIDWSADTARAQIMQTAVSVDGVNPGFENLLGNGRIDAAQALTDPAEPALYYVGHEVDGVENGRPEPGSTFDLNITLANEWADAVNVQATLSSADGYVTIVNNTASYGGINTFDSAANQTPFRVTVSGSAPYAHDLVFTLNVTADGGYVTAVPITVTTASGIEQVSGLITTNTIWTNDKQYIVIGNILVQTGVTLTVEAGTSIKIDPSKVLRIDGALIAPGTEDAPILFTSNNTEPTPGDWVGIEINYAGVANLAYCEISYAERAISSSLNTAQNSISHCYVHHNDTGIQADDDLITNNRIMYNNQDGITLSGPSDPAIISKNEIAYNSGNGIHSSNDGIITGNLIHHNDYGFIGDIGVSGGKIMSNTIVWNNYGIDFRDQSNALINHNNLWGNSYYDAYYSNSQNVTLSQNWWGTTDTTLIDQHIYDFLDDFNLGTVTYTPMLNAPESSAPGFLNNLTVYPESPIGIETATFDLQFSHPMNQSINPNVEIHWALSNKALTYNAGNSGLFSNHTSSIVLDAEGNKWIGSYNSFEGVGDGGVSKFAADGTWTTYTTSNSGLAEHRVNSIAIDHIGNKWFGTGKGLSKLSVDGAWTTYVTDWTDWENKYVWHVTPDAEGNIWVNDASGGVARLNLDGTWTRFIPPFQIGITSIAIDEQNTLWIGAFTGIASLTSIGTWTWYPIDEVREAIWDITIDSDGNKWLCANNKIIKFVSDGDWITYPIIDIVNQDTLVINSLAFDSQNNLWFSGAVTGKITDGGMGELSYVDGVSFSSGQGMVIDSDDNVWLVTGSDGVKVVLPEKDFVISDGAQWLSDITWQATFDVTSLVPRGLYTVTVVGAQGTDGLEIIPDDRFSFTVDYAGEITDQSPPEPPFLLAGGIAGNVSGLEAFWFANDADSSITGYRYALGSAPGATDIINWTATNKTSLQLSGLGLVEGQKYWLSVQARNEGGLWSTSAYSGFVAGQAMNRVFLPAVIK